MNEINAISVSEMMARAARLKEGGDRFTLMGIGPMSRVCVKASLLLAKERDLPVMLIASRNQVDSDSFGHGYVCDWDQERFVRDTYAIAREMNFGGLVYFCRDHGGPWQRDEERAAALPADEAMRLALRSYEDDMKAGFHLLHIDPTKDPHIDGTVPLGLVLDRTVELIEAAEAFRKANGLPPVAYEVGTEETNGGLTSEEAFGEFIRTLMTMLEAKGLPRPDFIVGQTGTLTRHTENIGRFNYESARRLSAAAAQCGAGLKQHNSDYLRDAILLDHPDLGVTAANIAPEFGVVETRAYLELAALERTACAGASALKETVTREAVLCERWRKWMVTPEERTMDVEKVLADETLTALITDICGHYTFETPAVREQLAAMEANLAKIHVDAGAYAVKKVYDSIDRYAYAFNMYGLTGRLMNA